MEQDFQKSLLDLVCEWPKNERHLLHGPQARALGDLFREFPEKIGSLLDLAGPALQRSDEQHIALLWTCLLFFAQPHARDALAARFLDHLPDKPSSATLRAVFVGVAGQAPQQREVFDRALGLAQARWGGQQEFDLWLRSGCALMPEAVRSAAGLELLDTIVQQAADTTGWARSLLGQWTRSSAFGSETQTAQALVVLDHVLALEPGRRQVLLDQTLDRVCRLIQCLDEVNIEQGQGHVSLDCLVRAGADWTKVSPSQHPRAYGLLQTHPKLVATHLEDLAVGGHRTDTGAHARSRM